MKNLKMRIRSCICLVVSLALSMCPLFPLKAYAQRGKPVVITFGQPNIWSLDQAHYLLSQLRERSLSLEAARLADLDPNETNGTRLNLMRQVFELAAQFTQPIPGASPTQAAVPEGTPERVASNNVLDGTVLGTLLENSDFQKKLFSDPKLNAITRLDNHIQLQYEIIARQLTLLRDEVRPEERLVFLELPQSIYTTDEKADNKVAQVYWQVDVYHLYDALGELTRGLNLARTKATNVRTQFPDVRSMSDDLCVPEVVQRICIDQGAACSRREELCRQYNELRYWEESASELARKVEEERDNQDRRKIERLIQGGSPDLPEDDAPDTREYRAVRSNDASSRPDYTRAKVRTIDIIPHQSSLNVNDLQETTKSSFISGAFSFLFGLGARTSFQRQRDQFEQFVHQELYASGFGKGDSLFGWTFGALPGTKRVAPGLRTTFAALIVPEKAESITLRARGCFFDRRDNQPPNAMTQASNSQWWDNNDRECGDTNYYRIRIPSGGGTANFWVNGIQYIPYKLPGQRMVAVIKGENFTTQVGVLVDGVPLKHVVEVTRKLPGSVQNNSNANCDRICGEYEVIGPNDVNIAFEMPNDFVGTPEITIVGPGRSISLNHLRLIVQAFGQGAFRSLNRSPLMFGDGPGVRLTDVKLFRHGPDNTIGVLRGNGRLAGTAYIYINGRRLTRVYSDPALESGQNVSYFDSVRRILRIRFANFSEEKLEILIVDGTTADNRNVANPFAEARRPPSLAVADDTVLAYDAAQGEMAVRLTGTGLGRVTLQVVRGASPDSEITSQSAGEVIVRLVQPRVAMLIRLTDPSGESITLPIVRRSPPRSVTEKRDTVDTNNKN